MTDLEHERIDVLEMDIEGAALFVLEHMLEEMILPDQIVVELEEKSVFGRCYLEHISRGGLLEG